MGKKCEYRLYCLESLQLCMRVERRERIALLCRKPQKPADANRRWNMDFVHALVFRILSAIDQLIWHGRKDSGVDAELLRQNKAA